MEKGDRVNTRTIKSKRRFYGNQHSRKETEQQQQQPNQQSQQEEQVDSEHSSVHTPIRKTISSSKIKDVPTDTPKQIDPNITGYRFVDVEILTDMRMVCCPDCKESGLLLHENFKKRRDLLLSCLSNVCSVDLKKNFVHQNLLLIRAMTSTDALFTL